MPISHVSFLGETVRLDAALVNATMPAYPTYDYLPDLLPTTMKTAQLLTLTRSSDTPGGKWENSAAYVTFEKYAILHDLFAFQGTLGATYDVTSQSYFDPYIVRIYDSLGNVIAVDDLVSYVAGHASFRAPYTGTFYVSASWHQGAASDHLAAVLFIYEDLDTAPKNNPIAGTGGKDHIVGTVDNDVVDGGAGVDTFVLGHQRDRYDVSVDHGAITVSGLDGLSGSDTLRNVERIQFTDGVMAFETTGLPPQAYRLYQAAFDRVPDAAGLGYWLGNMEKGASLQSVAAAFTASAEFGQLYGANPSNHDVLTKVYQNVLHRVPDPAGFDYWMHLLDSRAITVVDMLVAFSESAENQAQVIGSLEAGYFIAG